jgi:transposase
MNNNNYNNSMQFKEITNKQWSLIESHLPPSARTGRSRADDRTMINAITFVLITGCRWIDLPARYGSKSSAHRRFQDLQRKEIWNKYELKDNSFLKVKIVLTGIKKVRSGHSIDQPAQYSFDFQQLVVVLSNEIGTPDTKAYSPQELQSSIIKDDIRFNTITQDWNEYVIDDGTHIKLQPMIMKVAKISKFNNKGDPIYWVDINMSIQAKPYTS